MKTYTEDELQLIWKCSKYPAIFYKLIGYLLNYYGGTFNPDKGVVSLIFVYDEEVRLKRDKDKHIELTRLCKEFIRDTGLTDDLIVSVERDDFEKITKYIFISKNICNYITQTDYPEAEHLFITLFKPTYGAYPVALEQRLEFIIGSYLFHGGEYEGEWVFFNNYKKALMIHNFMVAVAEEDDIIEMTSRFLTPNVHKIGLNIDGPLWSRIKERYKNFIK